MSKKLYACNEMTYAIFKGNDQAFLNFVQTMNDQQKYCFIKNLDNDDLKKSFETYFGDENLQIEDNKIIFHHPLFHKTHMIEINDDFLETEMIADNPLMDFLYRCAPLWAMIDEKGMLYWLGYCQKAQNRVE